MSSDIDGGSSERVLRVEGDLDIARAEELKQLLLEAVSSTAGVTIDLTGTHDIDIAGIQLLWTACRESKQSGKQFRVVNAGEAVLRGIGECGLLNLGELGISETENGMMANRGNDR